MADLVLQPNSPYADNALRQFKQLTTTAMTDDCCLQVREVQ